MMMQGSDIENDDERKIIHHLAVIVHFMKF